MEQKSDLVSLPEDVLWEIEKLLFPSHEDCHDHYPTLLALCLTCRSFEERFRARLYAKVDLSMHTTGYTPENCPGYGTRLWDEGIGPGNPECWPDSFNLMWLQVPSKGRTARRQEIFLKTMLKRPEFSAFVTSFTWTLFFGSEQDVIKKDYGRVINPYNPKPVAYPHSETWTVFERLVNVVELNLAELHVMYAIDLVRQPPACLFPRATSIKLYGWTGLATARSILGHNISPSSVAVESGPPSHSGPAATQARNFQRIELHNLQHYGCLPDGTLLEGYKDYPGGKNGHRPGRWSCHPWDLDAIGNLDPTDIESVYMLPGTMTGILTAPLIAQCSQLSHLTLRRISYHEGGCGSTPEWDYDAVNSAALREWAGFVKAVRGTLQEFRFEEDGRPRFVNAPYVDQLCNLFLLPLFLPKNKSEHPRSIWPSLRVLEVRTIPVGEWRTRLIGQRFPQLVKAFNDLESCSVSLIFADVEERMTMIHDVQCASF